MTADQDNLILKVRTFDFCDDIAGRRIGLDLGLDVDIELDRPALKQARQLVRIRPGDRGSRPGALRTITRHDASMGHAVRLCPDRTDQAGERTLFTGKICALAPLPYRHAVARPIHGLDHALINKDDLAIDFRDWSRPKRIKALETDNLSRDATFRRGS